MISDCKTTTTFRQHFEVTLIFLVTRTGHGYGFDASEFTNGSPGMPYLAIYAYSDGDMSRNFKTPNASSTSKKRLLYIAQQINGFGPVLGNFTLPSWMSGLRLCKAKIILSELSQN